MIQFGEIMMQKVVVDASVIVKWYIAEIFSEDALNVRNLFVEGKLQLISPNLLPYEVLNALKYSKLFQAEELEDAALSLENYSILQFPLAGDFAKTTTRIANDYNISIYDASYVGLADIISDAIAYSADKKLVDKVQKDYSNFYFITEQKSLNA